MSAVGVALYLLGLLLVGISATVTVPRDALFKLGILSLFLGMLLYGGIPTVPE